MLIRAPRLVKVQESGSNSEGIELDKLPPADVPEARLFTLLQRFRRPLVAYLEAAPDKVVDSILENIIKMALHNPEFTYSGWKRVGQGRFAAEKAEITLDAQCAEILWRNNELRPVPDSMTQFSDFETLFGREPLRCGIVQQHEHRLWVHIVGTEFDLQQWDSAQTSDQGVGAPAPPPKESTPSSGSGNICLRCGQIDKCWQCPSCTVINCNIEPGPHAKCSVCGRPKGGKPVRAGQEPQTVESSKAVYNGVLYCRPWDPYSEEPHQEKAEIWFEEILKPVIFSVYPPFPPTERMPYQLLLPEKVQPEDIEQLTLIGCDRAAKPDATWKEVIVLRHRRDVLVYNLVSHGRRMFRSLVYASEGAFALHSMAPQAVLRTSAVDEAACSASGLWKQLRAVGDSLVVTRRNFALGGQEVYIPPRLLQGVIPGALLEAFHMWQGEDNIIRGEPIDKESSQWFNYSVELALREIPVGSKNWTATILRKPPGHFSRITSDSPVVARSQLLRQSGSRLRTSDIVNMDAALPQLVALGYSPAACKMALRRNNNNPETAASWLMDEANVADILVCELSEASAEGVSDGSGIARVLTDEGFGSRSSQYALNLFGGDLALARAWLSNEENQTQIHSLDEVVDAKQSQPEKSESPVPIAQVEKTQSGSALEHAADLILLSLLPAKPGSLLFRLANVLSRIEDISHVLVWGSPNFRSSSDIFAVDNAKISSIELPRLKVRFQPKKDFDGCVRLYLLDHAGWFISDSVSSGISPGSAFLNNLLKGIPFSLILENHAKEFRVMVANHDVYRPRIAGSPFSTRIVPDRGSQGWQQVMDMRYYLIPVHTSKTFLLPPTLSSLLYLILLRMLNRDYIACVPLIEAAYVDTPFTPEEKWIFDQFARTLQDMHPNAHAARLRLNLAVQYSPNTTCWEVHTEMDRYLATLEHVAAPCKLFSSEEMDILLACKQATGRIKNRLQYLKTLHSAAGSSVQLRPDTLKVGGQPWLKLCMLTPEYLDNYGQRVTRLQFVPPEGAPVLSENTCAGLVWDSLVMADEESGANRQLGFLFLYQLLRGQMAMSIMGRDCTNSFGELLTRCFHLKLARWGREQVEEGEMECGASVQMAALSTMLRTSDVSVWPSAPVDVTSCRLLREGLNIYSAAARETLLKEFMEHVDISLRSALSTQEYRDWVRGSLEVAHKNSLSTASHVMATPLQYLTRPIPDTSCDTRYLSEASFTADDFSSLCSIPLGLQCIQKFVVWEKTKETALRNLPCDISFHAASKTIVAQDMIRRIEEDINKYADTIADKIPTIVHLSPQLIEQAVASPSSDSMRKAIEALDALIEALSELEKSDALSVEIMINRVIKECNLVVVADDSNPDQDTIARYRYILRRYASQTIVVDINYVVATLLSRYAESDLHVANPFLKNSKDVLAQVAHIMLRSSRVSHANRAVSQAITLRSLLQHLVEGRHTLTTPAREALTHSFTTGDSSATIERLNHVSAALAEALTCRRHYIRAQEGRSDKIFDPRFLLFEYMFDILLRKRQVEMVDSFVSSARAGSSHVQQMIMGAGKTTVVGPLLALILADGDSLVVQVMPTALLEQSRNILRSCFCAIVIKHIYTLQFDRSVEDSSELVASLFSKLNSAKLQRSIVCAAPETIKSLMLKFVEQIHAIEQFDTTILTPGESSRSNREVIRIRDQMMARSDMADAIVWIFDLWRSGVLIMDEVDVLLHPLRSELNFPIGHKEAIDLSGHRWDLPIHLIDSIFYHLRHFTCEPLTVYVESAKLIGTTPLEILEKLSGVIQEGYDAHMLQRNPHLVLLDSNFYHQKLRPLISKWTLLWLLNQFVGSVQISANILLQCLQENDIESHREQVSFLFQV